MHKKNKGKNKPKNPNPTPPQQQLVTDKEPEQGKEEERVPEIVPEVVIPNVDEGASVATVGQSPAKPKRHRAGKKRKQNEAIAKIEESGGELETKNVSEETIIKGNNENVADTITCALESKASQNPAQEVGLAIIPTAAIPEEPTIMPAARKKKNKKNVCEKNAEPDKEKQVSSEKPFISDVIPKTSIEQETELSKNKSTPDLHELDKNSTKTKNKKNKQSTAESTSKRKNEDSITLKEPSQQEDTMAVSELKEEILIIKPIKHENIVAAAKNEDSKYVETFPECNPEPSKSKNKNKKEKKSNKQEHTIESIGIIPEELSPEQNVDDASKDDVNKSPTRDKLKIKHEENIHEIFNPEISIKNKSECSTDKPGDPQIPEVIPIKDKQTLSVESAREKDFIKISCESKKSKKNKKDPISSDHLLDTASKNLTSKSGDDITSIIKRQLAQVDLAVLQSISGMEIQTTKTPEQIKPDMELKADQSSTNLPPLGSNLVETSQSSFKKSFEALPLSDEKSKLETKLINVVVEPPRTETPKKEEFVTSLFHESLIQESPKQIIARKPETTDLKGKVMEVNKDMEDLKLSIEKSLAELTMMEEDDMPELVSITECTTPSESNKQEAISVVNVESQIHPLLQQNPSLHSVSKVNVLMTDSGNVLDKKIQDQINPPNELEVEKSKEKTQEQHHKKHKGKGKSSIRLEEPIIIPNTSIQDEQIPGVPPAKISPTPLSDVSSINPLMPETQPCVHEHKGKGKGKNKKKEKIEQSSQVTLSAQGTTNQPTVVQETAKSERTDTVQEEKKENKQDPQQTDSKDTAVASRKDMDTDIDNADDSIVSQTEQDKNSNESMDNFEDAMTSSSENLSQDIEIIPTESTKPILQSTSFVIPIDNEDMIFKSQTEPTEIKPPDEKKPKENPLSTRSKNLLGHPDIPVTSSKTDYKKEKNKNIRTPNTKQAKVKVKDSGEIDNNDNGNKCSKQSQTENKIVTKRSSKSCTPESDNEEEYVYKYSFRKVFLTNTCHVCKTELKGRRMACGYCNLFFYCNQKHKDDDWTQHQALCFAVSTIAHLKGLKFIYADASGVSGQDYRLMRMQVIVSCEKILKRKLLPCEQEALLYPRICCDTFCREWRSGNLTDCEGCGLVSYCSEKPQHLLREHQTWCKSYRLYYKLVTHQQSKGRLEPRLPSKIVGVGFQIPKKINELLAQVYEEKIDLNDIHYAALTQLATAPLTAAYSYQLYTSSLQRTTDITNGHQGKSFTLHIVGAELQFEADTLNKWEVFFLHLLPDVQELRVVFVGPELNPSKLPLDLLAKIKMCRQCRQDKRIVQFDYQDGQLYHIYAQSKAFTKPDIVCAFNPGLHRTTGFGGVDSWPETINCILKQKTPFCVTSYTKYELPRDLLRIRECSNHQYKIVLEPTLNPYASIRPDRNFISDDEMPLIFKNYYFMLLSGTA